MKKLLIVLFVCLCCTYCVPLAERADTLIVAGSTGTNIREGVTTYKIIAYDSEYYRGGIIRYRAKIGTFEIGDTVVIVKK